MFPKGWVVHPWESPFLLLCLPLHSIAFLSVPRSFTKQLVLCIQVCAFDHWHCCLWLAQCSCSLIKQLVSSRKQRPEGFSVCTFEFKILDFILSTGGPQNLTSDAETLLAVLCHQSNLRSTQSDAPMILHRAKVMMLEGNRAAIKQKPIPIPFAVSSSFTDRCYLQENRAPIQCLICVGYQTTLLWMLPSTSCPAIFHHKFSIWFM